MKTATTSPRIDGLEWGCVHVEGGLQFKDVKLFPGGAEEWDWTETGTRHVPGIQPADVTELIEQGARVVILSRGMLERLEVCPETLALCVRRNVEVRVLRSQAAVAVYNELRENELVGALIHSTC